jgi:hypothetical protein
MNDGREVPVGADVALKYIVIFGEEADAVPSVRANTLFGFCMLPITKAVTPQGFCITR